MDIIWIAFAALFGLGIGLWVGEDVGKRKASPQRDASGRFQRRAF